MLCWGRHWWRTRQCRARNASWNNWALNVAHIVAIVHQSIVLGIAWSQKFEKFWISLQNFMWFHGEGQNWRNKKLHFPQDSPNETYKRDTWPLHNRRHARLYLLPEKPKLTREYLTIWTWNDSVTAQIQWWNLPNCSYEKVQTCVLQGTWHISKLSDIGMVLKSFGIVLASSSMCCGCDATFGRIWI